MAGICLSIVADLVSVKRQEEGKRSIGRALLDFRSSTKYAAIGVLLGIAGAFSAYPLTIPDLILGAVIGAAVGAGIGKYRENMINKSKNFSSGEAKKTKVGKRSHTVNTAISLADEITQLHSLHQAGALSDDEFKAAKSALLNKQ